MHEPHPPRAAEVWRELVSIAWPIVGLNVLNVLALAVDTAMCGRLPDAGAALTGLGFATQILFLLMVAMFGLTVGAVALVARAWGAGELDRVGHVLEQATLLTIGVALAVAVAGNLVAPWLLRALGADARALPLALDYLRPLLAGAVFNYLAILYGAVLRGTGDTRTPLLVALGANAINVALNYGLILGRYGLPSLGVGGAALGTLVSQAFSAIVLAGWLRAGRIPGVTLPLRLVPVQPELARTLVRVGLPAAADMLVLNAAFLSIVGMLGRLDVLAVAAHGIGLRVQALAFVPGMSVSQATGVLVGQRLGRGDADGARAVVRASVVLCAVVMGTLAATILSMDDAIVALFGADPGTPVGDHALQWMRLLGYGLPVAGVYVAFVGMLNGAGATRLSLAINAVVTLALQIPASWLLGFPAGLGPWGVWAAFPAAFVVKATLAGLVYRDGRWARTGASV